MKEKLECARQGGGKKTGHDWGEESEAEMTGQKFRVEERW